MTDTPLFDLAVGFDTPRARKSDPQTSHEAADSITPHGLHASQEAVLEVLRADRYMQLMPAWSIERDLPDWSPSRVRSALVELERAGMVLRHKGTSFTPRGRRCDEFEAVSE